MIRPVFVFSLLLIKAVRSANVIDRISTKDGAICDDRIPAYLVADGHRISGDENKIIYRDVEEQECKSLCTENKDDQGNQVMCSSFSYNTKDRACSVHRSKAIPVGKLELKASSGHRYYEKFCLPEGTPSGCGEKPFFRADQAVLIGFAKNVSHTKHLATCIQACVEMSKECKSAMFFGAAGECILSIASAQDAPDVFAEEQDEEKVVYFENGCTLGNQIRAQKKHGTKQKETDGKKTPSPTNSVSNATDSKSSPSATESKSSPTPDNEEKNKKEMKNGSEEKKKLKDSEEDEGVLRTRKPSDPDSENDNEDEGDKGAGDGSHEKPRRIGKQGAGRKASQSGQSNRLLQNAALSNETAPSAPLPNSGTESAWGPWSEECRSFDERRPCQNGNRVGFQSRQCVRTPFECQGPFFRYCITAC